MRTLTLLILAIALNACTSNGQKNTVAQNKNTTMVEQFDTSIYQKTGNGFNNYTKEDGYEVYMIDRDQEGSIQKERLPKPSFYTITKEFYANGNLKKKEKFIGEYVKVGISEYYNQNGSLERKSDEDKKFGNIKPDDVLLFLEKKNVINMATGKGRTGIDGNPVFELHFEDNAGKKIWLVTVNNSKPNTSIPDKGEPVAFLPETYKLDGETGAVIK